MGLWLNLKWALFYPLIARPLRARLGLAACRIAVTGGAPLGPEVFTFFRALGLDIRQVYGQSETAAATTAHTTGDAPPETVGPPLPHTEVRISEEGEIQVKGPQVFQGYFRQEKATEESFTEDGFFRTGDAGFFDERGHLVILGRVKEVGALADGTRFAPQFMENRLKYSPYIREARQDEAYASTPLGRLALGVFLLFLVLLPFLLSPYPMYVATLVAIGALSALGLHLLVGGAGQISLGHAAFMGVGAYTASHLYGPLAFLGILLGGGIAALLGLVLGLPSLRIKGVYLAIATLAFQFLADYVFKNWEGVTGGIRGRTLPPAELFGLALDTPEKLWYLVLFFTLPLFFYGKRLLMTRAGRAFMAVRDNDLSARVAGVDLVRVKLMAFALSAFYAGVAGGLLAQLYKAVTPEYFPLTVSIQYLAMVIVGGAGTVLGAVLGAFFVLLIPEVLNSLVGALGPQYAATLAAWRNVAFGLLILAFLILEPLGLVGLWGRMRNYFRTWPLPY